MSYSAAYLKNPAYFFPSLLGPVWLDLIRFIVPSWTIAGFSYVFTIFSLLKITSFTTRRMKTACPHRQNNPSFAGERTIS